MVFLLDAAGSLLGLDGRREGKAQGAQGDPGGEGGAATGGASGGVWFGRTLIRSCHRYTYAEAQRAIDAGKGGQGAGGVGDAPRAAGGASAEGDEAEGDEAAALRSDVQLLHSLASARCRRRTAVLGGRHISNRPQLRFDLDEQGRPTALRAEEGDGPEPNEESHSLVEELMLLANFLVARRLVGDPNPAVRAAALLRHHVGL